MSNSFYHERYCLTKAQQNRAAVTCFQVDRTTCFKFLNSIYHKFRKWCADDVFENLLQALVANTEKKLLIEIDSTFCKVRRGGKTTKIHALVNENFQLLQVILSGGLFHDGEFSIKLFENLLRTKIKHTVQKSFAYSSQNITQKLAILLRAFSTESKIFVIQVTINYQFAFCTACSRYDTNLDFTNTP